MIFSQIEIIKNYNQLMLQDLQKRIEKGPDEKIADIFLRFTDFLKVYCVYINNYFFAFNTLRDCSKNPKFIVFLEDAKKLPESRQLDLQVSIILK